MVLPHRTSCKSTEHQPTGQLALRSVPPPQSQESQHDSLHLMSQEEEPFKIDILVSESLEAQYTLP
jgi:hypothetical protein